VTTTAPTLTLTLPWPPSTNTYLRHFVLRGHSHATTTISEAGRHYHAAVGAVLVQQRVPKLAGPLAMRLELYPPDARPIDVDNFTKPLLDALKRRPRDKHQLPGAWIFADDDNQVRDLHTIIRHPLPGGTEIVRKIKRDGTVQERRVRLGGKVEVWIMPIPGGEVQADLFDALGA
jgi:Holliday junction resolvase RusA-like endonuclease